MKAHPTRVDKKTSHIAYYEIIIPLTVTTRTEKIVEQDRIGHEALDVVRTRAALAPKLGELGTNYPSRNVTDPNLSPGAKPSPLCTGVIPPKVGVLPGLMRPTLGVSADGNSLSGPTTRHMAS